MRRAFPSGMIIAALAALPASAQEKNDNEEEAIEVAPIVVESATRTETPVDELTRSVSVVDEAAVEKQKRVTDRTVGEILSLESRASAPRPRRTPISARR